ncbi:MAG: hypothetical protein WAU39_06835 [Polyangiales bacterium]
MHGILVQEADKLTSVASDPHWARACAAVDEKQVVGGPYGNAGLETPSALMEDMAAKMPIRPQGSSISVYAFAP